MENRNGLLVDLRIAEANGKAEREVALDMLSRAGDPLAPPRRPNFNSLLEASAAAKTGRKPRAESTRGPLTRPRVRSCAPASSRVVAQLPVWRSLEGDARETTPEPPAKAKTSATSWLGRIDLQRQREAPSP